MSKIRNLANGLFYIQQSETQSILSLRLGLSTADMPSKDCNNPRSDRGTWFTSIMMDTSFKVLRLEAKENTSLVSVICTILTAIESA